MGICYIVGAGEFNARDFCPQEDDFVIAADGGLRPLLDMGCRPDLLMGDLDSLGSFTLPADIPLERFPVEKDDTDTGIALAHGWEMGYRTFHLYGCGGGRIDHLLANFQSMGRYAQRGASIRLVAGDYDAYAISNTSFALPHREPGTTVSVFCHGSKQFMQVEYAMNLRVVQVVLKDVSDAEMQQSKRHFVQKQLLTACV